MSVPTHSLRITAASRGPGPARPAVADAARGLAGEPPGGPAARHLAARRPLRADVGRRPRGQGDRREPGPPRVRPAAHAAPPRAARGGADRHRHRPARRPTAGRSTRCCSPGTCSSRCPTARCSRQSLRADTATRLIDALAVLLVRLHLTGFYWGDVSLSNTLFRRDAGAFAAYLVDAETGDLHDSLSRRPARARPRPRARRTSPASSWTWPPAACSTRRWTRSTPRTSSSSRYRELWGELDRARVVRARRALAGARADRAAQRPRVRRRRAQHQHRPRRDVDRDRAEGRGRRAPHPPPAAADRARRRGEPGPPAAQRPRHVPRGHRPAGATTRRSSPTSG